MGEFVALPGRLGLPGHFCQHGSDGCAAGRLCPIFKHICILIFYRFIAFFGYYCVYEGGGAFGEVFGGGTGVLFDAFAGCCAEEEGYAEAPAHFAELEYEEACATGFAAPFAEVKEGVEDADTGA